VFGLARQPHDPDNLGHTAVMEWIDARVVNPADDAGRDCRFMR
jgi:hypothetical protein